ncbi:phosphate propanoyltransferase [Alkalihalobacillus sp. BA299]|uniref:phosphate propanoyltransferase n=1 Tax=Alkalihalobacillus sp. BA299 TaxID=2815938 RepID=UPI001AD9D771|nr:phosphate propanoyltransferase [Alkalihalobacillus sp. BA299]
MDQQLIESIVKEVVTRLHWETHNPYNIPIAVSARHCHLSKSDLETLFGEGYELTKKADLSQPGQFASNETVTIVGPKGSIEKVRILGPARNMTQVEISKTDSIKLGFIPPLRESGDIEGSSPITIEGPKGSLSINKGLIIAQAHIHMEPKDAKRHGVENGEYVKVEIQGERPLSLGKVLIRVSPRYKLEMHVDTDEANAGFITGKTMGKIVKDGIGR